MDQAAVRNPLIRPLLVPHLPFDHLETLRMSSTVAETYVLYHQVDGTLYVLLLLQVHDNLGVESQPSLPKKESAYWYFRSKPRIYVTSDAKYFNGVTITAHPEYVQIVQTDNIRSSKR